MTVLGYALALLIGLSLGLLGGGGSILTVPVLHYVLGYPVKETIPMSLVVVGLTSGFGAIGHWRAGTVRWRTALGFGPPAIVGAILGAELGLHVEATTQLTVFAIVLLAAAVSMLRGGMGSETAALRHDKKPLPFITLVGALVGVLTGFVGVGGGFLYVPALVLLGGLAMKEAIGTSLGPSRARLERHRPLQRNRFLRRRGGGSIGPLRFPAGTQKGIRRVPAGHGRAGAGPRSLRS